MKFTFRQLEYFVAAAEAGSIAAAAERIHISAPSISVAITQLEQQLGVLLFIRQRNGLSLTTVGQDVLERANSLLEEASALHAAVNQQDTELKGRVTLGCLTTLAPMVMPELVQSWAKMHPAVVVELVEDTQDQLISHLRRGVVDVAITYEMHIPPDLEFETLASLPPLLMMPANHRLSRQTRIDLQDVVNDDYILLDLPYSRDYFLSVFQHAGLTPRIGMRTTQMDVVRTMVANGLGVSVVVSRPLNEAALDGKPIVSVPIANRMPLLSVGVLVRRAQETTLIAAFRQHARASIGDDYIPGMRPLSVEE
ncbi:MAG: LysR family transcriptional regulator [Rhodoferax sp.]|nr:LysR family transcriptional regulator [Rhodoferax sp.]